MRYVPVKMRVGPSTGAWAPSKHCSIRSVSTKRSRSNDAVSAKAVPSAAERARASTGARSARYSNAPRANQVAGLAAAIAELDALPQPADSLLHDFFRRHKAMGQQDRALIADGVFAWFRRRRSLTELAQTRAPRRLALAVFVRELGIGVREWDGVVGADDLAWLREFKSRLATPLAPAVAADLPDWLWERLGTTYGDAERAALARAWLAAAPLDLRVNRMKATREAVLAQLASDGIARSRDAVFAAGRASRRPPVINRHPLFVGRLS